MAAEAGHQRYPHHPCPAQAKGGRAAVGEGRTLYAANRDVYQLLRYGVKVREAAIENNIRKVIIDEQPVNPQYYGRMSELLDALIHQRKQGALDYKTYLDSLVELAGKVHGPSGAGTYPATMNTAARRALYDNLEQDEDVVLRVDHAVLNTRKADWKGHRIKEREVFYAVDEELGRYETRAEEIFEIVKNQREY